jgi:hypothetical protein
MRNMLSSRGKPICILSTVRGNEGELERSFTIGSNCGGEQAVNSQVDLLVGSYSSCYSLQAIVQ